MPQRARVTSKSQKASTIKTKSNLSRSSDPKKPLHPKPIRPDQDPAIIQPLLDTFTAALSSLHSAPNVLQDAVQEVKGALYRRDFSTAFGSDSFRSAYALRWSAARAPAYRRILSSVLSLDDAAYEHKRRLVCLGGGAGAELVAAASLDLPLDVICVDVADWTAVVNKLSEACNAGFEHRKVASCEIHLVQRDLLSSSYTVPGAEGSGAISDNLFSGADVVTLMFTLNELYSESLSATQNLLLEITAGLAPGALMLVVDSPGSYSTVKLASGEKRYPMAWLLEHTLLRVVAEVEGKEVWEKMEGEESVWFRLPSQGLVYPLSLEDMRYQHYVYRRL